MGVGIIVNSSQACRMLAIEFQGSVSAKTVKTMACGEQGKRKKHRGEMRCDFKLKIPHLLLRNDQAFRAV
jgi:hypothetical protein